jgi:5'-3' exonuclease
MKANFVIDGSGIFYRSLFSMSSYKRTKEERLLDSEESKSILMRKLATDFSALVRSVEGLSRVIICLDSSSWRKRVLIEDGDYKGNREKDPNSPINWNGFYEITDEFTSILAKKGYIISKVSSAEADDLLYLWSKHLNNSGENVILVTGDRDLLQCVSQNSNGTWTVSLDPVSARRKISVVNETLNYNPNPGEVDIFDSSTFSDTAYDMLTRLLKSNDVVTIIPENIRFAKVILGDAGDNVPSLFMWPDPKDPNKIRRLTDHKFNTAVKKTGETYTFSDFERVFYGDVKYEKMEKLRKALQDVTNHEMTLEKFISRIKRNYLLVILNDDTIPKQIQETFSSMYQELPTSPIHMGREFILEGTKWWTRSSKDAIIPKSFDLF